MGETLKCVDLTNESSSNVLIESHDYIKKHSEQIIKQKFRNHYHLMPEIGWLNDPNGFSVYKDEYHLFYQYYPYDIKWGPMHWGHAVSKDLIKWDYMPVALAPDQVYDKSGCFSGSAIEVGDKHVLMYTGHVDPNMSFNGTIANDNTEIRQVQCLAIGDGKTYVKVDANPVIGTEQIPNQSSLSDFRDPKIWEKDNTYYCVVGSRDADESGKILLYKSDNLFDWDYVGVLDHSKHELGRMWECPDVFELDGTDILIFSPQQLHEDRFKYKNGNSTVYFMGTLNYDTAQFSKTKFDEIDYGLDFYAPQTTLSPDGRRIMVAWMQSWDRNIPSDKYGWVGAMTLPRELKVINDKLYQYPVKEIEKYRKDYVTYKSLQINKPVSFPSINGRQIEVKLDVNLQEATNFKIHLMQSSEQETLIHFNVDESILTFDRSQSQSMINEGKTLDIRDVPIEIRNNKLTLRIFIDTYSVEIFVNDGEYTLSSTVYSDINSDNIVFEADGQVEMTIEKWNLVIE